MHLTLGRGADNASSFLTPPSMLFWIADRGSNSLGTRPARRGDGPRPGRPAAVCPGEQAPCRAGPAGRREGHPREPPVGEQQSESMCMPGQGPDVATQPAISLTQVHNTELMALRRTLTEVQRTLAQERDRNK